MTIQYSTFEAATFVPRSVLFLAMTNYESIANSLHLQEMNNLVSKLKYVRRSLNTAWLNANVHFVGT